jgi:hypothetical protein
LNLNPGYFGSFTFILVLFGKSCLLVSWCAGAIWRVVMRIVAGVGDLVQRTGDGHTGQVLGGRTIERLGDAMCSLHYTRGDEERVFLG